MAYIPKNRTLTIDDVWEGERIGGLNLEFIRQVNG